MFAYCGNNPVNFFDPTGQFLDIIGAISSALPFVFAAIATAIILSSPAVQETITKVADSICIGISSAISSAKVNRENKAKEKEKDVVIPSTPKNQAYFTVNPYNFKPVGLVMTEYPGTTNGRIIEWRDPISKAKIFEWNEDFKNGPHYHAMLIGWDGNHMGTHYEPGAPVPEPWNTKYFGG